MSFKQNQIRDIIRNKCFYKSALVFINCFNTNKNKKAFYYQVAWSPRRYWRYAVTNKPAIVTGTNPKTIPDNKGSTIKIYYLIMCLIFAFIDIFMYLSNLNTTHQAHRLKSKTIFMFFFKMYISLLFILHIKYSSFF